MMKKGFTLIEMLVTVGLFAIIITIAVGGFTNAIRTQRQVSSLISAQSNVSLALEQMSRAIRTGYLFCSTPGNPGPGSGVANSQASNALSDCGCVYSPVSGAPGGSWTCDALDFYDSGSNHIVYELPPTGQPLAGSLVQSTTAYLASGGVQSTYSITGDTVTVKYLKFQLFGETEGDHWPPRITISIGITPSSTDPAVMNNVINLQTTVSARNIDCTQTATPSC